jgi:hypothetical protein
MKVVQKILRCIGLGSGGSCFSIAPLRRHSGRTHVKGDSGFLYSDCRYGLVRL